MGKRLLEMFIDALIWGFVYTAFLYILLKYIFKF